MASAYAGAASAQPAGATVVTNDRGRLLLALALVAPERRNRGVDTVGNPAQRLCERLGFVVDPTLR